MKLNRLIAVSIVGFSLLTTSSSAFACDHDHDSGSSWSWFGWCHHDHDHDHDHEHDGGGNTGSGGNCPGHGGSSTGGGGSTTTPPSTGPKGDNGIRNPNHLANARESPTMTLFGGSFCCSGTNSVFIQSLLPSRKKA
ncbi:hypothetical protein [Tunturiibacter gelidiferens]|uniref:hypothetical protein n=1 Tax=Tunturiibacter gelidiferens TaxID=3069689 RepID=UPI003D9AFDEF